ncbi:MAG: ATP-binding protein [Deltaproteobacteria bacterium]|nr:ATP-binding protein [Deltaproteobacteria bacterium]
MRKKTELEIALSEEKELSEVRRRLLERNLKELEDLYAALREKLQELKIKDEKIREIEVRLERANKLSLLGEISSAIAHQIKNPLVSILGFAKRITTSDDVEKVKSYAKIIVNDAEKLTEVLQRLLEFSRMDQPKKEKVELNEAIKDTLAFLEHHLTRFKNVNLIVELEEGLPPVELDKIHLQQVLANLLINAAQAMPQGGPIKIRTGFDRDKVFFSVTDKGHGISDDIREKIFEPFFTTKKKGEGTGLGLSICKRLVEANGGTITFTSQKGEGTTFFVYFPLNQKSTVIPS